MYQPPPGSLTSLRHPSWGYRNRTAHWASMIAIEGARQPWNLKRGGMALKGTKVKLRQRASKRVRRTLTRHNSTHSLNIDLWRATVGQGQEDPQKRHPDFHEILRHAWVTQEVEPSNYRRVAYLKSTATSTTSPTLPSTTSSRKRSACLPIQLYRETNHDKIL